MTVIITYLTSGTWTCPMGIKSIYLKAVGGGGGGGGGGRANNTLSTTQRAGGGSGGAGDCDADGGCAEFVERVSRQSL